MAEPPRPSPEPAPPASPQPAAAAAPAPTARLPAGARRPPRLGPAILGRQSLHALKALMLLAEEPQRWRSVADLAASQELRAPLLEQQLLRLRRAGLLQARRGRSGGFRLAQPAETISLAAVLAALRPTAALAGDRPRSRRRAEAGWDALAPQDHQQPGRPPGAGAGAAAGGSAAAGAGAAAADRVALLLEQRLWRILERELASCTLADLLHDLRSARALLGEGAGWLLG